MKYIIINKHKFIKNKCFYFQDIKCVDKQTPPLICDPPCDMGECVSNGTSALGYCKCNPFFAGETCNVYECHKYCHNKAYCYVVQESILEESKLKVVTVIFFSKIS